MHTLNMILVNMRDLDDSVFVKKNGDDLDFIRTFAAGMTDRFEGEVFDWRETDTAGRWAGQYSPNVLLGKDDPGRIPEMLEELKERQKEELEKSLGKIRERLGTTDLAQLAGRNLSAEMRFYLQDTADWMTGRYTVMSSFYDTCSESAAIPDELIECVRKHPENWAAVLFDHHW